MKHSRVVATAIMVIGVFSLVAYTACTKPETIPSVDPCAGVTCQNGGNCLDGKCSCALGFAGEFCGERTNKSYLGKWRFSQVIASSNDHQSIGDTMSYIVEIKEDNNSPIKLTLSNFMGNAETNDVKITIHQQIGAVVVDSVTVETDVISTAENFIFNRNQPLSGTLKQITKGEGTVNSNATVISGYFYLTSPHQTLGVLNERIDFDAYYMK